MITKRTKLILWLGTLPLMIAAGGTAFAGIYYLYYALKRNGQATYFVILHFRLLPMLIVTVLLFVCALISHLIDRRRRETK